MTKILLAQQLAHEAHDAIGQKRKYTGEPYWAHTDAVASLVAEVINDEDVIAAAHLHDVIEDVTPLFPNYNSDWIVRNFGNRILGMVIQLTDLYTKESFPQLNRSQRKAFERSRIEKISADSKTIKLADLINNTESIVAHDKDFAQVYIREKLELLPYLINGHPALLNRASLQVMQACQTLSINIPTLS